MKRGYHSTQSRIYGIPRSEFYGFLLGYAAGLLLSGALKLAFRLDLSPLPLVLAAVGALIGVLVDRKYFQEKDEPEDGGAQEAAPEGGDQEGGARPAEGLPAPDADSPGVEGALAQMASRRDGGPGGGCSEGEDAGRESMQKRLKKMFEEAEQ